MLETLSPKTFLARFGAVLSEDELGNHMVLGRLLSRGARSVQMVTDAGRPVLAAVSDAREKWALGSLKGRSDCLTSLIETISRSKGFMGPRPAAEAVASGSSMARHVETHLLRELRVLEEAALPDGVLRPCQRTDLGLAQPWMNAFFAEALPHEEIDGAVLAEQLIARGDLFFFDAGGEPVAMGGKLRPCFTGIAIAYVYTPPRARGRGYGTAITAALSRHLLETGWSRLWLFTIATNPVSNHIYQKLGFRVSQPFEEFAISQ